MKKILIFSLLIFLSCNKEKSNKNHFFLTLEAIYAKNDTATVYFCDKNDTIINKLSKSINIKAKPEYQKIEFDLPKNIKFSNLMICISKNTLQENIQIKTITFKNNDDVIVGSPGDMFIYYFVPKQGINLDFNTGFHKLFYTNGNPSLIGNELFEKLIKEEIN